MTRDELASILTDLVARHAITPEEAAATLARFDAGDLADMPTSPPAQDDNRWALALALLLLLVNGSTRRPLTTQQRNRARAMLRLNYEHNVAQLAVTVAASGAVAQWQAGMQDTITSYAHQMAVAGAGTLPRQQVRDSVDEQLAGQWGYLAGFAATVAAKKQSEQPLSLAAIAARAVLYGSVGWAAYFMGSEQDANAGYVVNYIARDDRSTCGPCSEAERNGPYLPGQGPYPGSVCLGSGNCRCERVTVYDLEAYNRLTR